MKFLILNTDYPEFLRWLYAQHPGLEEQPYEEQMRVRAESLFGVADFYSSNLRKLGHEAWDIHANNEFMQKAWAREHGIQIKAGLQFPREGEKPYYVTVPAYTLSEILDRHSIQRVDLLSLDVEGYEAEVLRGIDFERNRPRFILIEVRHSLRHEIETIISPWYRLYSLKKNRRNGEPNSCLS